MHFPFCRSLLLSSLEGGRGQNRPIATRHLAIFCTQTRTQEAETIRNTHTWSKSPTPIHSTPGSGGKIPIQPVPHCVYALPVTSMVYIYNIVSYPLPKYRFPAPPLWYRNSRPLVNAKTQTVLLMCALQHTVHKGKAGRLSGPRARRHVYTDESSSLLLPVTTSSEFESELVAGFDGGLAGNCGSSLEATSAGDSTAVSFSG